MMNVPDEHDDSSPAPDSGRPALRGMPPAWQFVYDRISEGHAAAVLGQVSRPDDTDARALLYASSAAVRAFREAYEKTSRARLAAQINRMTPGGTAE